MRANLAVKLNLATTFSWWLFHMQKAKKKPRTRRGEDYDSFCLVTINAFTRSQSFVNSG